MPRRTISATNGWLSAANGAGSIADTVNAITVSRSPKIASATYDATTWAFTSVAGANMTVGDMIGDGKRLSARRRRRHLFAMTTPNTTATGANAFSVTLSATDMAAVNQLLNKAGTSSTGDTPFNLAAAADWDSTASAPADLTGNGITVANVPTPIITSAA